MLKKALLVAIPALLFSNITLSHPNNIDASAPPEFIKNMWGKNNLSQDLHFGTIHKQLAGFVQKLASLDLSKEQRNKLNKLREENQGVIQAGWQAIKPLSSEMQKLLRAPNLDELAVRDLAKLIFDHKIEQLLLMSNLKRKAIGYLTKVQKQQMEIVND